MSAPRFSIVIPHLAAPLLDRVLLAALDQVERLDGELILVGQEREQPRLDPWRAAATSRLKLIDTAEPLSPGLARNLGFEAAATDRLLLIDADALPLPGWAAALCATLEHHRLAGGAVEFGAANRWMLADNVAAFFDLTPGRAAGHTASVCSVNMGIGRELWRELGGFDPQLVTGEDYDLVLRAIKIGVRPWFEPAARVLHLPERRDRRAVEQHARWWAAGSARVRRKHGRPLLPGPLFSPIGLRLLAAPLALAAAAISLWNARHSVEQPLDLLGPLYLSRRAWFSEAARALRDETR